MSSPGESDPTRTQGTTSVSWEHLDRYLFGDDSTLDRWLSSHPESRAELNAVRTVVQTATPDAPDATGDALWAAMSARMTSANQRALAAATAKRSAAEWRKRTFEVAGIAAVALVAIIAVTPHFKTTPSAISGPLPLSAIPDSSVAVGNTPAATPGATPSTAAEPVNTDDEPVLPSSAKARRALLALDIRKDTLVFSSGASSPSPELAVATPVSTIAEVPPGAADTDWP